MAEEIITSTNVETATDHEYNASEIQVLKGLEAVRKRPGMYIGSTGERGLHHLVYEIVDNAIDEALAGYCNHIEVKILKDNIIQVTDNGRGIPVDIQADTGLPAVTVVYTILHAGGKFGGENSGYKVAGGLHGVGASVVNACSEWLTVNVRRDGHEYEQTFRRGDPDGPLKCLGTVAEGVTGTRVTFKPDPEMFKDTTVYNFETLEKRLREESFLNAGVKITLTDERELYTPVLEDGQEGDPCYRTEVMCYEGGIREFVTWINRNKTPLHEEVIYMAGAKGDSTAEIAMQYNDSYAETMVSFANDIHTPEGGMHETGFKAALTRVLNAYGIKYGMIKEGDKVSGEDVREGITAVISVKLTEAQFEGQTKAKLGNAYIRTLVDGLVSDQLSVYLEEHPVVARTILDKALTANRAREAARKARESIRRKTALGGAAMPDKLRDCNENNPELTEIYIVEGDSALGACKQSRDAEFQGLMPVRGKILNCLKADYPRIFKSDVITDLMKVLGCGVEVQGKAAKELNQFDLNNLRWSKVVICTDGDVDGFQIRTLILTMLYRLCPTLIKEGYVYIAETPLFEITCKEKTWFAYSEKEKAEVVRQLEGKKYKVDRSKGLGENDPEMMWLTTMNPETRRLVKVLPDDAEETARVFDLLLGDNLSGRKDYIAENGCRYLDMIDVS